MSSQIFGVMLKKTLVNNKNVYLDKTLEKILMMEFFSKEIFENTINNID